jgi:hypothetical protein
MRGDYLNLLKIPAPGYEIKLDGLGTFQTESVHLSTESRPY